MIYLKDKQEIARENGKKSRGPITPEGKRRSSLNSITHGLASKCVVLANESEEAYTALLTGYQNEWQPATQTEQHLVIQIANSYWRLRRIWSMETALLDSEMFTQKEDFEAAWSNHHPGMRLLDALSAVQICNPALLVTLSRYETRYQRTYKSSIEALRKMRRHRHAPEIEFSTTAAPDTTRNLQPDPQPQPEPAAPTTLTWLTRFLAFILSLLSALRIAPSRAKQPRNKAPRTSEPTTILDQLIDNFHFPEIFLWTALLSPTPARPKPQPHPQANPAS
ncbi:MAG TPA: hypothetical protein VM120_02860 [Bryobacteraceae bacterium]|nr:hypothetical protein [Bryobacteraceae bacterium]